MKRRILTVLSLLAFSIAAHADVWMWIDAAGKRHFVDTQTPIYMWVDGNGEVHYSDTPESSNAISVQFEWYSAGTLQEAKEPESDAGAKGLPGETEEERFERERAEAYYCKVATELYESYVSAPHVYRTAESGEREYLSKTEKAQVIADTRAQKDEFCQ